MNFNVFMPYILVGLVLLFIIMIVSFMSRLGRKTRNAKQKDLAKEEVIIKKKDILEARFDLDSSLDLLFKEDNFIVFNEIKHKKKPVKVKKTDGEEEVYIRESNFGKDHIYDEDVARNEGQIVIFKDIKDMFRFKLITSANETVALSMPFKTKNLCKKYIQLAINIGKNAQVVDLTDKDCFEMLVTHMFVVYKDNDENFRFMLQSGTMQKILISEGYKLKSNCINGIKSVISVLEFKTFKDLTLSPKKDFLQEVYAFREDYYDLENLEMPEHKIEEAC